MMETARNAANQVHKSIAGDGNQSGTEPPSGMKGQGNIDSAYDAGNAPETTTQPGIEPPSGQTGEGTIDEPYDTGNAPGIRPPSASSPSLPLHNTADSDPLS